MGYNANLLKAQAIPSVQADAGTPVVYPIIPAQDARVTIPSLRIAAGASGGDLFVLQTACVGKFSLAAAGVIITVPGIPAGLTGRQAVIRFEGGEAKATKITGQEGEALTLADQVPATSRATLYVLEAEASATALSLTPSATTVFSGDCPGAICGKELGWPIALYLANADGNEKIEGGTVACIGV